MLVNSVFGLLVPIAAEGGIWTLIIVRFIQGLGEVGRLKQTVQRVRIQAPADILQIEVAIRVRWYSSGRFKFRLYKQKVAGWCLSFSLMYLCIGTEKWTFLARALLYHARTLFWRNGFHLMREVVWVRSFTQVLLQIFSPLNLSHKSTNSATRIVRALCVN